MINRFLIVCAIEFSYMVIIPAITHNEVEQVQRGEK
jgi:hypothetical protein